MKKKNYVPFMILFLVLAGISIWGLVATSKEYSVLSLAQQLSQTKKGWIVAALASMPGFIIFEGMAISCLIKGLCGKETYHRGSLYAAADIYFSAITPSASGGQPASAFFMMRDGISGAKTTVILLVNLIMYCYALLLCGGVAFLFEADMLIHYNWFALLLVILGAVFIFVLSVFFWLLLKKEQIIHRIALFFLNFAIKFHLVKHGDRKRERLEETMRQFRLCADEISGKGVMLWKAFGFNVLQRIAQSLVTVFCYMAVGGSINNMFKLYAVHMYVAVGANSIPIPGGMGVSDYLLLHGLRQIGDVVSASNLALISRGVSFYGCIIVSIILVIIGYISRKRKGKMEV